MGRAHARPLAEKSREVSVEEHQAEGTGQVRFAVLTVSDTRTTETDESGQLIIELVQSDFHVAAKRALCKDDASAVADLVHSVCGEPDVDVLVITGGTGLTNRDTTYEAVKGLYDIEIPGFGELFRALSFEEVGAAAMLSRASAGVVRGRPVFSLPGSTKAVRLAMERLILPEIGHVLQQLRK